MNVENSLQMMRVISSNVSFERILSRHVQEVVFRYQFFQLKMDFQEVKNMISKKPNLFQVILVLFFFNY